MASRRSHVRRRQIDADDRSRWLHFIEQPSKGLARPASRIEHPHPRSQAGARNQEAKLAFRKRIEAVQLARVVPHRCVAQQAGT
jgi:hypothetical protein